MRHEVSFVKFQGCGNDFLILDETVGKRTTDRTRSSLAKKLTDRRFQVGADGLMFLEPASDCDCSMRLFEPAGNEADMCGNGIRCIAAYMMEKLGKNEVDILTRDGVKRISRIEDEYKVEMGQIRTTRASLKAYVADKGRPNDSMMNVKLRVGGRTYRASMVNSGEPHIVIRTRNLDPIDMASIGKDVNANKKRFPKGINVNFVQVEGQHAIKVRTYERGVYDETMACGTGATASAAVALILHWVKKGEVKVLTRGGPLRITMDRNNNANMIGPAERVYSGQLSIQV